MIGPIGSPNQRRDDPSADDEGHDEKPDRHARDSGHAAERDFRARRQSGHDREDHEADHVVDHRRPENDLSLRVLKPAEIGEHASGDADAGGGQRRRRDDRRRGPGFEPLAGPVAAGERQDHADGRHCGRRAADADELGQVSLQPDLEEQQNDAKFGEQVQRLLMRIDEVEHRRTEDDARDQLAEHGRLTDSLGDQASELGRGESDDEQAEEGGDVHWFAILCTSWFRFRARRRET